MHSSQLVRRSTSGASIGVVADVVIELLVVDKVKRRPGDMDRLLRFARTVAAYPDDTC